MLSICAKTIPLLHIPRGVPAALPSWERQTVAQPPNRLFS
jgi:hypothetical protein